MSGPFTGEGRAGKAGRARSLDFPVSVAGVKLAGVDGLGQALLAGISKVFDRDQARFASVFIQWCEDIKNIKSGSFLFPDS